MKTSPAATKPKEMQWTAYWRSHADLLHEIQKEYPSARGHSAGFERAFRERPEWKALLLPGGGKAGSLITWARNRFFTRPTAQKTRKPYTRRAPAGAQVNGAAATPEILTCPCCHAEFVILRRGQSAAARNTLESALAAANRINQFAGL